MKTHIKSAAVLIGIITAAAYPAFACDNEFYTGPYGHTQVSVDVPYTATLTMQGYPGYNDSYIWGGSPVPFNRTPYDGPLNIEQTLDPGTYPFDLVAGSSGWIYTNVHWPEQYFDSNNYVPANNGYSNWVYHLDSPPDINRTQIEQLLKTLRNNYPLSDYDKKWFFTLRCG